MTNGYDATFSIPDEQFGLTKREHFAAMAMQGLLSADMKFEYAGRQIANMSVRQAGALIAELNKEQTS